MSNKLPSNDGGGKKRGRKPKKSIAPPASNPNEANDDYLKSEEEAERLAELAAREEIIARIVALPPEMQVDAAMSVMTFIMEQLDEEAILALRKEITEGLAKEFGNLNVFKTTIELIDGHLALRKIKKEMGPDSAVDDRSED